MDEKNKISCSCGSCQLFLNDPLPKYSVMCACEDCRQALRWAEINGGKKPKGGEIVFVYGSKGEDIIFGEKLTILDEKIYTKLSEVK